MLTPVITPAVVVMLTSNPVPDPPVVVSMPLEYPLPPELIDNPLGIPYCKSSVSNSSITLTAKELDSFDSICTFLTFNSVSKLFGLKPGSKGIFIPTVVISFSANLTILDCAVLSSSSYKKYPYCFGLKATSLKGAIKENSSSSYWKR